VNIQLLMPESSSVQNTTSTNIATDENN